MPSVMGIDLASRSWSDTGTALLEFDGPTGPWTSAKTGVIDWPSGAVTAAAMADELDRAARTLEVSAVSIDGPQGWRDPAAKHSFCGRACEREARTPGKVGAFGVAFPGNYLGWVQYSIEVFELLLARPHVHHGNDAGAGLAIPFRGDYWLLECFPTSTWISSGLAPLPGHRVASPPIVEQFSRRLVNRFALPQSAVTDHHDHLQAVVAALPAAALLGGPCEPVARGEAARRARHAAGAHWVEGLIWDARPLAPSGKLPVSQPENDGRPQHASNNPILPDDRSESGRRAIQRGVELFEELVKRNNAGALTGVSYQQFVELVHGMPFRAVCGRTYKPGDTAYVIELAYLITAASGGRKPIARGPAELDAAMDTLIWNGKRPHARDARAWANSRLPLPYTEGEWRAVFPNGMRALLAGWAPTTSP